MSSKPPARPITFLELRREIARSYIAIGPPSQRSRWRKFAEAQAAEREFLEREKCR